MLDAIKHITDDIFSFRKTAHRCIVCVTQFNQYAPGLDEADPVAEDDVAEQLVGGRVDDVDGERIDAVGDRRAETVRQHVAAAGVRRIVRHEVERAGERRRRPRRRR